MGLFVPLFKNTQRGDAILNDLDLVHVMTHIAAPYRSRVDFSYCNRIVNASTIERIQIVQTAVTCAELAAHVAKQGTKMDITFGLNTRHGPFFRGAGVDYTNEILFLNRQQVTSSQTDFVIVTALEEEFDAVTTLLPKCEKLPPSEDDTRVFFQSEIDVEFSTSSKGVYRLALLCLHGMGRVEAANATNDAIRRFSPRYVLLVGIAGGISNNDVELGDVLISNQVVDYELQKVRQDSSEFRFVSHNVDPRLLNAVNHYKIATCLDLVSLTRPAAGVPKKHVGPIATGDKVVANSEFLSEFLKSYPKAIGVEMESGGVASAAFKSSVQPGFFMIRATSDLADNNKDTSEIKPWRNYACNLAAAYTIGLLKSGPVTTSGVSTSTQGSDAPRANTDITARSSESQKLVDAKNEMLLRALEVHDSVQTVNRIGAAPFFFVARKHPYKDDEEVLLFLEALKQLLSDGHLEGYFERAGKNYPLTYKGLQLANKLKVERPVSI
jgi:nucleoside phosphorylase